MIEQTRQTQRRILAAQIPPRLRGLSLLDGEERRLQGLATDPPTTGPKWTERALSGAVVAAVGQYETCGKGLWATGTMANAYMTATMRDLMVQTTYSGLYLPVNEYLDSVRPEGDRRFSARAAEDSIVVLSNVGTEPMTEWTRASIRSLILKRFDAGLPTLVSAVCEPSEYLVDSLAEEIFVRIAIMSGVPG